MCLYQTVRFRCNFAKLFTKLPFFRLMDVILVRYEKNICLYNTEALMKKISLLGFCTKNISERERGNFNGKTESCVDDLMRIPCDSGRRIGNMYVRNKNTTF